MRIKINLSCSWKKYDFHISYEKCCSNLYHQKLNNLHFYINIFIDPELAKIKFNRYSIGEITLILHSMSYFKLLILFKEQMFDKIILMYVFVLVYSKLCYLGVNNQLD